MARFDIRCGSQQFHRLRYFITFRFDSGCNHLVVDECGILTTVEYFLEYHYGGLVELVNTSPFHGEEWGFELPIRHYEVCPSLA